MNKLNKHALALIVSYDANEITVIIIWLQIARVRHVTLILPKQFYD